MVELSEAEVMKEVELFKKECRLAGYLVYEVNEAPPRTILDISKDVCATDWLLVRGGGVKGYEFSLIACTQPPLRYFSTLEEALQAASEYVEGWG